MAKQFNDNNFQEEVIEMSKEKPVLVDFFASWCMPCQMQAPIIDEVGKAIEDKAIVGKMDTEEAGQTASQYGVQSIPTLIVFKDGEAVETMVGLQQKDALISVLEKHM